ncbi:MAG: class I SAM-dependent methyltransferase [Sulfuricaulis sp.]|uniref:class I SAM-dependent methyltransferase n=1 Tax=Sulfuricaulis sp. TaxID=2003553 RepID=UPI0034A486D6
MLRGTYFPRHDENRMLHEGDVEAARDRFFRERPISVTYLLRQRYSWMNEYLLGCKAVVELGAGAGLSKEFLDCPNIILSDVVKRPWIDIVVDALNLPFGNDSLDAVICSHMIHHLANPARFFSVVRTKLKLGGFLLIQDLHTSLMLRILLRIMRHEGWSYDINVFNENTIANDPSDPWSANCAIPELLFSDELAFENEIPGFRFLKNELNESLLFPLSGGVIAKTRIIQFPSNVYKVVQTVDRFLVYLFPNVFAVGRSVVLEKTS